MNKKAKILYVEDDIYLSYVTKDNLELKGYTVVWVKDGVEALKVFSEESFDLCVLDIMLPQLDGFSVAQEIRKENEDIPILFLSAKTLKEDKIKGLTLGADDYITKPFSIEELSLRISAILKRSEIQYRQKRIPDVFDLGTIKFDHKNMVLIHKDEEISLTRKESALLKLLAENKNQLVEREYALEKIWGSSDYFIGRSMDVFIAKLRKMLKIDPNIAITNVHGTGFKLEVNDK